MVEKRVTLQDIARASGVHIATVSRVLHNDPQIGAATTQEVRRIAEEMGYKPDPMLTALSAYRSSNRKQEYKATIAWITNDFTRHGWNSCVMFDLYFKGARERAAQLGYELEEFWLREPGLTAARATSVLKNRAISGLIVAPQPKAKMRIRLDWSNFSAVAIGLTTAWPRLNTVTNHHFDSMVSAVRHVRSYGYRRIALVVHQPHDERSNHAWTGAFLAQQQRWPAKQRIPILSMKGFTEARFEKWLKTYRPDAVISYDTFTNMLETLGYRIPQDIGFASLGFASHLETSDEITRDNAGIDENALETGAVTVDLLVGMIHRGERGIPKVRHYLLVEGSWRDGKTLCRQF
jgi:DNA-binding LacI/PurR family transcriptional regulator